MERLKPIARCFVSVDPGKCTGCTLCESICAFEKEGVPNPLGSRIRVMRLNPLLNLAVACMFCQDAPCVKACTRVALKQSDRGGLLIIDEKKCDACGWCIQACSHGAIMLHPDRNVVVACDLCGGEPKCVEYCPEEALELVSDDKTSEAKWVAAVEKMPSEIEKLSDQVKKREWAKMLAEAEAKANKL